MYFRLYIIFKISILLYIFGNDMKMTILDAFKIVISHILWHVSSIVLVLGTIMIIYSLRYIEIFHFSLSFFSNY